MPSTKTSGPGVMKFTILVDPSLVTITILSVCLIYMYSCPQVEKKILFKKKLYIFTKLFMWPRPSTRTHAPRNMKFTIFVDPSLVIITIIILKKVGA